MALQFVFPEAARLRRLASSLALPRAHHRSGLALTTPTHAYFLSFPWDGRPVRRRRSLDMRTMSVGAWFEAVPWQGTAAIAHEEKAEAGGAADDALHTVTADPPIGPLQFFENFFEDQD
jgi:hypothetical protein